MLLKGLEEKDWKHKLKLVRVNLNLKQGEAAKKIGVEEKTYQRWEQGKNLPSWENRKKIAEAFDCDGEELFGEGWLDFGWNG